MGRKNLKKGFTLIELLIGIILFVAFFGIVAQSYVNVVRAQKGANEVRRMYSEVRNVMDVLSEEIRLGAVDYECMNKELNVSLVGRAASVESVIDRIGSFNRDKRCSLGGGSWQVNQGETDELRLLSKDGRELTIIQFVEGLDGYGLLGLGQRLGGVFGDGEVDITVSRIRMRKFVEKSVNDSVEVSWEPALGYEAVGGGDGFVDLLSDSLNVKYLQFAIFPVKNPYTNVLNNAVQFQPKVTVFLSVENAGAAGKDERNKAVDFRHDFQTTVSSRIYSEKI